MNSIEQLQELKKLLDSGAITNDEFQKLKSEVVTLKPVEKKKRKIPVKAIGFSILGAVILVALYFIFPVKIKTLVPYLKANGKYVYVDSANLKVVIADEFETASLFKDGISLVRKDTTYYFIV